MTRPFPLPLAFLLVAASAVPTARAQSAANLPAKAAPLDPLPAVRAHLARLRLRPLALPPPVVRAPQAVPPNPWSRSSEVSVIMTGPSSQSAHSGCFR